MGAGTPVRYQLPLFIKERNMAELKNIRIAVSGLYDYAYDELPTLRVAMPGNGAPDWVEKKDIYKVYRPAPVLAAACDKFKMLPLTHHHPRVPVDGQNFRDLAVGYTGENPEVDYLSDKNEVGIKSTLMMYDDEALKAYDNGEIQLSPGYIAVFEWKKGTAPNGEPYDIIMKEITEVNHLALLPNGRGGEDAVVLDNAPETKDQSVFDLVKTTDGAPKGNDNAAKDHVKKEEVVEGIIKDIHDKTVAFPEVEFNDENYERYLGQPLDTPIGKIKISDNQKQKLIDTKRTHLIGAISETLKDPAYMCRDTDGKIIFIKSFDREGKQKNIISVMIERDTLKINVSTHYKRDDQIKNIITRAEPLEKSSSDHGTVHDERVAEYELTITDEEPKVKSIFEIVKGSVFDRVRK